MVIIEGPTGCGKTTQVPQWILDEAYNSRKPCKIIVTQPRKIAAISIARRVAQERGWDVGGLVGYQVRTTFFLKRILAMFIMNNNYVFMINNTNEKYNLDRFRFLNNNIVKFYKGNNAWNKSPINFLTVLASA